MSKHPLCKSACALATLLFCLAFGAATAAAQSTTNGAIGGTVKDPQGAVVPTHDAQHGSEHEAENGAAKHLIGRHLLAKNDR